MSRGCPLCGWSTHRALKRLDYALPDQSRLPASATVALCDKCEFVYAESNASEADYLSHYQRDSIYAASDLRGGSGAKTGDSDRLAKAASRLEPHLSSGSLFIDIGAATGGLLKAVQKATRCDVLGLDPDKACVEIMRASGFSAERSTLSDLPSALFEQAHAIALSHVLEHLWGPREDFARAIRLLRTGGVAYVETPNAARYSERPNALLYYFDSEHINHFTLRDFELLALFTGCSVLDSGDDDIVLENGDLYPIAWATLKKQAAPASTVGFQSLGSLEHPILGYINQQSELESSLAEALFFPLQAAPSVLIWGAGSHAQRMLARPGAPKDNILAFIDSDPSKEGALFLGKNILSPDVAFERYPDAPILIVAAASAHHAILNALTTRWPGKNILNPSKEA